MRFLRIVAKAGLGLVLVLALCLSLVVWLAPSPSAVDVDLTRYLLPPATAATDPTVEATFVSVAGPARLIVSVPTDGAAVTVSLNGRTVVGPDTDISEGTEIPVMLAEMNTIRATRTGAAGHAASIRVKQHAEVKLHVLSRIHFNTNVSDFAAARAFYGTLGFETLSGFPDTNTLAMARAIGIDTPTDYDGAHGEAAGGYHLHGELIGVGGFMSGVIDLIEFTVPRNDEPPYAQVNHLGMARAAMLTTNIEADYAYLTERGVAFIAPPTARADGTRFALFTDPDGTFYELVEVAGEDAPTETTHITGLGHVNVNVSDFERSLAWYRMFGYEPTARLPATDSLEVARAMGLPEPFEIDGAMLHHEIDGSAVEIIEWRSPHDATPPYPIPINHLGIHRIALTTSDIAADVATLRAQGVEFISDVTPCCSGPDSSGSIVAFYDPDGTIVELAEQPFLGTVLSVLIWFRNAF